MAKKHRLDRNAAIRAKARIDSYYFPRPHEEALRKERDPFERAKAEWLKHTRAAIAEVEEMTFEDWSATRSFMRVRKPDQCSECGQQYRKTTLNGDGVQPTEGARDA